MLSTDRVLISGLPGSGKSVLAAYFALQWYPDVFIFDTIDQHRGFPPDKRYVPKSGDISEFEAICKRLCTANDSMLAQGHCVLIIEECEDYIGQGRLLPQYAYKVVRQGRNWGVGIVAVTQRIQEVDKKFVDRCNYIFFFHSGSFSYPYIKDLRLTMTNLWYPSTSRINVADAIERLNQFESIGYNMKENDGKIFKVEIEESHMPTSGTKEAKEI